MIHESLHLNEIQKQLDLLKPEEQLLLVEHIAHKLRSADRKYPESTWSELYGIGKGIWEDDAQDYVNKIREERY